MAWAYLGLGSNMGNRRAYLKRALEFFKNHKGIKVKEISSIYESEAVGEISQPNFYNMVVAVETLLSPRELLKVGQAVEELLKRERKVRWGPRPIDVDILLYNSQEINSKELTIPHPELPKRTFVLVPLLEIAPDLKLPSGEPLRKSLSALSRSSRLLRIGNL